jgi:hypothetical protein
MLATHCCLRKKLLLLLLLLLLACHGSHQVLLENIQLLLQF